MGVNFWLVSSVRARGGGVGEADQSICQKGYEGSLGVEVDEGWGGGCVFWFLAGVMKDEGVKGPEEGEMGVDNGVMGVAGVGCVRVRVRGGGVTSHTGSR
jgi:hypothetical protein